MVEQAAPKVKKVFKNRTTKEALEELEKIGCGGVEEEMSKLGKEVRKGKWETEADKLVRTLLGVWRRWPEQRGVVLHIVGLLLKRGLLWVKFAVLSQA